MTCICHYNSVRNMLARWESHRYELLEYCAECISLRGLAKRGPSPRLERSAFQARAFNILENLLNPCSHWGFRVCKEAIRHVQEDDFGSIY
jgi:hypothetical protein